MPATPTSSRQWAAAALVVGVGVGVVWLVAPYVGGLLLAPVLCVVMAPLYRRRFDAFFYVRSAAVSLFPWSIVLVGAAIDASPGLTISCPVILR